jgi:hypothetical protein
MTRGSGSFFTRVNASQVATAMATVFQSMSARRPRAKAAPAIAPVAAAVTPSTNERTRGLSAKRRKYGAGMTMNS